MTAAAARSTCFLVKPRACVTIFDLSRFPHDLPSACCYCAVLHTARSLQLMDMRKNLDWTSYYVSTLGNQICSSVVIDIPAVWQLARRTRTQGHGPMGSRGKEDNAVHKAHLLHHITCKLLTANVFVSDSCAVVKHHPALPFVLPSTFRPPSPFSIHRTKLTALKHSAKSPCYPLPTLSVTSSVCSERRSQRLRL